jgi:uracil-DNA glycosylase
MAASLSRNAHAREVRACRRCANVEAPPVIMPLRGRVDVLLVGQAPGPHERDSGRLFAYTSGTRLFSWFAGWGVSEEEFRRRVWISATIRCFPGRTAAGGDRSPSPGEIAACAPHLERELALLRPRTVLALGTLAIAWFLGPGRLAERVGRAFACRAGSAGVPVTVFPLPHPSGRSTWLAEEENRRRLERALSLIRHSEGWRATFGEPSRRPDRRHRRHR